MPKTPPVADTSLVSVLLEFPLVQSIGVVVM
jgi:hypothetical protein